LSVLQFIADNFTAFFISTTILFALGLGMWVVGSVIQRYAEDMMPEPEPDVMEPTGPLYPPVI